MTNEREPPDLPDDTVVLGGEEPEPVPGAGSTFRWKWPAAVAIVLFIATIAWLNRPRPDDPPHIADDPIDQGSRSRPLYPGAEGRLLFTVQVEPRPGEISGERLYSFQLDTGAVDAGPLLPPVGTAFGIPAGPGIPPQRSFALGPPDSPSAGLLAFLGDGEEFGLRRFAYILDVGRRALPALAAPVTRAHALWWAPDGALLTVRQDGNEAVIERALGAELSFQARVTGRYGFSSEIVETGGRRFLIAHEREELDTSRDDAILEISSDGSVRTLLRGYRVLGVGRNTQFLVAPTNRVRPVSRWVPGSRPQPLEGFAPEAILGWTADRQHYAARGEFRGGYGVWFVAWPNSPVFLMHEIQLESSNLGPDLVAFDRGGGVAFFVNDLDLWMVEIGSERSRAVPLPDDVARETPSGPLVWVP